VFVVDGSGSLSRSYKQNYYTCSTPNAGPFDQELQFVDDVIETLSIGKAASRAAVIQFASKVRTEISLVESAKLGNKKLMSEVKKIQWSAGLSYAAWRSPPIICPNVGSQTATPDAMAHAQKLFQSEGRMKDDKVAKMVFILTDGEISPSLQKTRDDGRDALAVAKDLMKMGVQTYSIGVGRVDNVKMKEDLLNMAGGNEAHRFMVTHFDELKSKVLGTIQNSLNCDV